MTAGIVRLGTRGSSLARWQTDHVAGLLMRVYPSLTIETVVIATKGDHIVDKPLPMIGGKGLFTAELEAALHSGQIDMAVHSLKDLPTENAPGLTIGAVLERASAADVLVSRGRHTLETLPPGSTIGTGGTRRAAQLRRQRPDLTLQDIRGNIDTRIQKALDPEGPYDAIVLAQAGLARLGMEGHISQVLPSELMLPAPGQGALAVQCCDEAETLGLLMPINHHETALAAAAERAFLAGLGGGCSVPVAAYAHRPAGQEFLLRGRVCTPDGSAQVEVETRFTADDLNQAVRAGAELARRAVAQGAAHILKDAQ